MSSSRRERADLSALSSLAPELAEMLASVASDVALVVDANGIIERVALGGSEPVKAIADEWIGRRWADTVTSDTRKKVEDLLRDVAATGVSRARQVNHPSPFGLDIPIAYSAVRLGLGGPLLAVGRDMSVVSAMQQRLVQAQQEMERDYWQRRQAETRYQLLFQIATDAVLVVDAGSLNVLDANRAAARLFSLPLEKIVGAAATAGLDAESAAPIERLLMDARTSAQVSEGEARLPDQRGRLRISITVLRTDNSNLLLMRLRRLDAQWQTQQAGAKLVGLMGNSPDAIVIVDGDGRVVMANPGFLDLARLGHENDAIGHSLGNWLGSSPGELASMLSAVRADGLIRLLATRLRAAQGPILPVELSAALIREDDEDCVGFIIRASHHGALEPGSAPDRAVH